MPLNALNTRTFHRFVFAGILETIVILKRDDDQKEGTVRSAKVFDCRRSLIVKTGEPIQEDMTSDHRTTWHIPRIELDRAGVDHLNPADRIVDKEGRYWQPESTTVITEKMFSNHVDLDCLRVDP